MGLTAFSGSVAGTNSNYEELVKPKAADRRKIALDIRFTPVTQSNQTKQDQAPAGTLEDIQT